MSKKDNAFLHFKISSRLLKCKKAAEKLMSVWWFFALVIVGAGIVLGVMIYYSADTSVKKVEAEILSQKIIDCISENSRLNNRFFNNNFNALDFCGLNPDLFGKNSNFYIRISIYNESILLKELSYGANYEKDCQISQSTNAKKFPQCYFMNKSVFDENGNELKMVILTGSNQEGTRASLV